MRSLDIWIVVAVLTISSCGKQTGHRVEHLNINGVRLIRTIGGPKYESPLFELKSDLVIGVDEGEPEWQLFYRDPRSLIAPDGTIVLVDPRRLEIFIVSKEGQLISRLGGKGSGPGEFESILDVLWAEIGHEIWITDQRNSRITRLNIDGELIGQINYSDVRSRFQRFMCLGNRRFLAQGVLIGNGIRTERYSFVNERLEIITDFITIKRDTYFRVSEFAYSGIPFSPLDGLIPFPDGRILVYLPSVPRLSVYSTEGELQYHIERDWETIPIISEEKESIRNSWRERGQPEVARGMPFPEHKPFFSRPLVDTEGRIWLRRYEAVREQGTENEPERIIGYEYEIYDLAGVWLGTHVLRHEPRHITGEYIYQSYTSEAGAPRFERVRIHPIVREMKPRK